MKKSRILGTGHYVPPRVVTNADLEKVLDTSDAWIQKRTGIAQRHFVDEGTGSSDLAVEASLRALDDAGLSVSDLDFIIVATLSPDHDFPGVSCFVQEKLGIPGIGALDIRAQCSGFIYGLSIADQFISTGHYRNILLVGAEVQSTALDFTTGGREMAVLFGDGAGAVVLGPSENNGQGVISTHLHADGRYAKELWMEAPGFIFHPRITPEMIAEGRHYPKMNGKEVFKGAVKKLVEVINHTLDSNGFDISDVDIFIPHQANLRINDFVGQKLGLPREKVFSNIHKYGNTTAASIPIALDEARKEGRIDPHDLVLSAAFGAGFTWGAALIRW